MGREEVPELGELLPPAIPTKSRFSFKFRVYVFVLRERSLRDFEGSWCEADGADLRGCTRAASGHRFERPGSRWFDSSFL